RGLAQGFEAQSTIEGPWCLVPINEDFAGCLVSNDPPGRDRGWRKGEVCGEVQVGQVLPVTCTHSVAHGTRLGFERGFEVHRLCASLQSLLNARHASPQLRVPSLLVAITP
ncbi:hypothetical protein K0M31_005591, partial [Melipona bicolor]